MFLEHQEGFGGVVDISRPSAKALAWLLRHRERWPRGFVFEFMECEECAIGLMKKAWGLSGESSVEMAAEALGISISKSIDIFIMRGVRGNTPEAIATDLENL